MARFRSSASRQGATVLEFAVIGPLTFLLILGLIVGGLGIFRYQEVAHLAREASRYASTHGGQYKLDGMPTKTGVAAIASASDMQAYVADQAVGMDSSQLSVSISWSAPSTIVPRNIPTYMNTDPTLVPPAQKVYQNYATVTVSYQWMPEVLLVGPINLTSTSTVAMSY